MCKFLPFAMLISLSMQNVFAQDVQRAFDAEDYVKALWMATRFYGGQRSGDGPNWLIMDTQYPKSFTQDKYEGTDVSGGWFDCGDHVMFGQTQYWSAYSLAKAYQIFPRGFYDFYSPDYSGYVASGNWGEPEGGKPNGIPDIIDELVYEADYIVKAAIDDNTFISLKGNGDLDHKNWVTSGYMSTLGINEGGEPRDIRADKDRSMASYGAATLAVMSRILDSLNIYPERVTLYKQKALTAYNAATKTTSKVEYPGFYPENESTEDDYATASIEMYLLTGEQQYLQNAKTQESSIKNENYWVYCYNNNYDMAWFNLAVTPGASSTALSTFNTFVDVYKEKNKSEGKLINVGNSWGTLRYPLAAAFVLGLADVANGNTNNLQTVYDQVDFVMGANNNNRSFISGFLPKSTSIDYKTIYTPHHRNVFQSNNPEADKNNLQIPQKNRAFGALVANDGFKSDYDGRVEDYQKSEVCTDYNVGLVGALAYIVSIIAPAPDMAPPEVPIKSTPNKINSQSPIIRFTGTYIFPAQNKSFTVKIFNSKGDVISVLKSNGQAVKFIPQNFGVYYAVSL